MKSYLKGIIPAIACLLLLPGVGPAQTNQPSAARLICNVPWLQPGTNCTIGLLIKLDNGGHTYWQNPGDSGMAPQLEWSIPAQLETGPELWPYPELFKDAGGITFGHTDKLLICRNITAPADLELNREMSIKVKAAWPACRDICVPQSAELEIKLAVRADSPATGTAWSDLLAEVVDKWPVAQHGWFFNYEINDKWITLRAKRPPWGSTGSIIHAVFFPLQQGLVHYDHLADWEQVDRSNYQLRLKRRSSSVAPADVLTGVLVLSETLSPFKVPESFMVEASRHIDSAKEDSP